MKSKPKAGSSSANEAAGRVTATKKATSAAVEGDHKSFAEALKKRAVDDDSSSAAVATTTELKEGDLRLFSMFEYIWCDSNWPVWRQFIVFSAALVITPLCTMLGLMRLLRALGVGALRSDVWAVILSVTVINVVISFYAFKAYQEERSDYEQQHALKDANDKAFKQMIEDRRAARQGEQELTQSSVHHPQATATDTATSSTTAKSDTAQVRHRATGDM
eukprot:Lankesteria_metandrocarpae@DN2319_c0_g1_i1.p1